MSEENGAEAALLDQIQLLSSEVNETDETEDVPAEEQRFEDPGTPLESEYPPEVEDDSEDEDDFKIIIDDTRTNVTFRAPAGGQRAGVGAGTGKTTQKLDLDATAMINGAPLYDLDLANLEDKPWRKPGADLTDYFNYGFTEETWLMYCERHRKLRAEFGPLANRQLFSQLTGIANQSIPVNVEKIAVSKYTPVQQIPTTPSVINNLVAPTPVQPLQHPQLIMRTVLTVPASAASTAQSITPVVPTPAVPAPTQPPPQQVPTLTSSVPHPQTAPPPVQSQLIPTLQQSSGMLSQSPPDSPGSTPPPSSGQLQSHPEMAPPGVPVGAPNPESISVFPDLSMPPPRFPPTNLPPPSFTNPIPGLPPINVPPPMFGHPPPPGVPLRFPPPYGFPPPSRPRIPSVRHSYRVGFPPNFESTPRDDARSPASYSDKSSDEDDRDRYDRHRRHGASDRYRRSSRSPSSSSRSRYSTRDRDRDRSSHRGSRYRSRSPVDRSHHGSHDDRKESRSGDKRRKSEEDDLHKKSKKRKIKEEPLDDDELDRSREKSSKKSKEKEDKDKERSSSSKKRKKSKERQETEHHHTEEEAQKT